MYRTQCTYFIPAYCVPWLERDGLSVSNSALITREIMDLPGTTFLAGHGAFINGFWLDEELRLVRFDEESARYWVPPSAFIVIERVAIIEGDDNEK